MDDIYGIGIESSCDETGIAIIKNGRQIVINPVFSQVEQHKIYGGVVPEMASRLHLEKFPQLLKEIMEKEAEALSKISYIAVTVKPGLVGSLLIGYHIALGLRSIFPVPVIPVNHLEAHFYASRLSGENPEYPFLGLLLSGGNSAIFRVSGPGKMKILGDTFDDACGEALDKAASMLGLNYPGGPEIEKKADLFNIKKTGEKIKNPLPKILAGQGRQEYNFSYSGLKTALYYWLQSHGKTETEYLAWCFQERAFEIVERNLKNALMNENIKTLVAAGGVMANGTLRKRLLALSEPLKVRFICPPANLCTDNGAMVGALGYVYFKEKIFPGIEKTVSSKVSFPGG